jgi:hypothetical protein
MVRAMGAKLEAEPVEGRRDGYTEYSAEHELGEAVPRVTAVVAS